jgi:glycosyltransferase involved in cell wall biosynthesis
MITGSPFVTVLMPVYNGSKYLGEVIESVLNQIFTDFKFLIIDDGSSNDSIDISKSYDEERRKSWLIGYFDKELVH